MVRKGFLIRLSPTENSLLDELRALDARKSRSDMVLLAIEFYAESKHKEIFSTYKKNLLKEMDIVEGNPQRRLKEELRNIKKQNNPPIPPQKTDDDDDD